MGMPYRLVGAIAIAALSLLADTSAHALDAPAEDRYAAARHAFQAAYAQVLAGHGTVPAADDALLRDYPLYPYLEAARIRQALLGAPQALASADAEAGSFLVRYAELPVAGTLQRAWLESLASRASWALFLSVYREGSAGDPLRCQSFSARIALGRTSDLVRAVTAAWLTPHTLQECSAAFAWLEHTGALTAALIEQRVRLALESGNFAFARQLLPQLPPERASPLREWADLLEHPQRTIDALIGSPQQAVEPQALLAGWTQLARSDPGAAKRRFAAFVHARGLTRGTASPYALALALALAWNRDPDSREYFARVSRADFDDAALEWRARAALWSRQWRAALRSVQAMSVANRGTARWRYWTARALEALDEPHAARALYRSLLTEDDYYSALAAARLGQPVAPHPQSLPVDPVRLAALGNDQAIVRARELYYCGMRTEAEAEWRFAYDALSPADRLQMVALAARWGWYDQAVPAATAQRVFNDYALLYPRPYDREVEAAAHREQIAPEILYGIVRQESLYQPDAVSPAGAIGLMQLMPDTARRTAHFTGLSLPGSIDLKLPDVNIALGAARLRMLLDALDRQMPVALAGYNAGLSAARRWLPHEPLDTDIWIENIPFNETREYVQRILWHSLLYAWLRDETRAQPAAAWLVPVRPLPAPEAPHRVAETARRRQGTAVR